MSTLHDFPIQVRIPVAWGEMDSFGHLNNIYYFRYFETTRIHFFQEIGLLQYKRERGIGPILAETSCRFRKPVFYPDTLTIGARVKSIGKTSFIMEFRVMSDAAGLAAAGEARMVLYDYNASKKTDIPAQIKTSLSDFRAQLP
ncbi:MAG: acyl-CoA thioesterase [Spirochaetes bacterium]|nr:acyl-CoA thioesterase [Spirochaetota bacterium]